MSAITWRSGERSPVFADVCADDLLCVRLALVDPGEVEDVGAGYRLPHLVYLPAFGGRGTNRPGIVGGMDAPTDDRLEYRVDLAPLFCPYQGQVCLDGGRGAEYRVHYERARCASRHVDDPTLTLHRVGGRVDVPRGAYALSVVDNCELRFGPDATQVHPMHPTVRWPLGFRAMGWVEPADSIVHSIAFHLRF
ncbi:hypothetical protein [Chondromyces apiculatus]|uniref:Uncharacterized protein n=1 Tax=Chondromyces apiculatus DSM 436 TaxID=1192034 RepID=A0A017SYN0_9BACT|nr:hypothetical protein [Chondromyces apiculatus]EYF01892.1 Hypothetical protein CAP_7660 [Chondromyces apiculatus DSM 436]